MKDIILLHGAIGASDQLIPIENILKTDFNVYRFSFSGHGNMPFKNEFGIKQFAFELENFILSNKLQRPSVFGFSMGGYVALYLASQKPSLMGNVVTLGTKFKWSKEIAEREILQLNPKIITEKVPKFAEALKQLHGQCWEDLLKHTAEMMVALGENNLLSDELLGKVENKVLLGLADGDKMVSTEETFHVFNQLRNADKFTLSNSKHPIETADTMQLAQIIKQFC